MVRPTTRWRLAAVGVTLLAGAPAPVRATAFCEVLPTRDGFVALRAAASGDARLLRRLRPGDMVQLDRTRNGPKGWVAVLHRTAPEAPPLAGWVADRLIEKECG